MKSINFLRTLPFYSTRKCFGGNFRSLSNFQTKRSIFTHESMKPDELNNVPSSILSKIGKNLHNQKDHPLEIIKRKIQTYFNEYNVVEKDIKFKCFDNFSPIVSVKQNFDELEIPLSHESRKPTDSYYINKSVVLRTHTSAHQTEIIRTREKSFLITGDVYRRDEIDKTHYPIFHQMEGVRIWHHKELPYSGGLEHSANVKFMEENMKKYLEGLCSFLFGNVEKRWVDAYFPFTHPSWELEIFFEQKWLEVLGSGIINQKLFHTCNLSEYHGWAFGIGLERLAMVLFKIPDIRLFWSTDPRFLSQFEGGKIVEFKPYSKYPSCTKDISFWVPSDFHPNNLFQVIRDCAGDLVESVELVDKFLNPKTQRNSYCYRIFYRSMDRNLTNEEINQIQENVRKDVVSKLNVELR